MKKTSAVISNVALLVLGWGIVSPSKAQQAADMSAVKTPTSRPTYYINLDSFEIQAFLPNPPTANSAVTRSELLTLHRIEDTRTAQTSAQAKYDEESEDIFLFKDVMGGGFTPDNLPATAALSKHIKLEQGAVGSRLKSSYSRMRPYQLDPSLHPICKVKTAHDSYPSGHALTGYLEALALVELVPEKRDAILARADEYGQERLICGVHYPSDIEASKELAYAMFGFMLSVPSFQHDLATAKTELDHKRHP